MLIEDPVRLATAAGLLLAYSGLCTHSWNRARLARGSLLAAGSQCGSHDAHDLRPTLVAFASQTGFAEELAEQAASVLREGDLPVRIAPLGRLTVEDLRTCSQLVVVASTCREGDAPDNAQTFVDRVMDRPATLAGLRFTLLALGDRSYTEFCAFGRRLDTWLQRSGASEVAPRIEVDAANEIALCAWRHRLAGIAQVDASDAIPSAHWGRWLLKSRRHLNPGSAGAPVFEVVLATEDDSGTSGKPLWQAGDLLQLRAEGPDDEPRSYSIASLPEDGAVHLLVRLQHGADGRPGLMSGLLTGLAPVGTGLAGRIRANRNFRLSDNAKRPLILIGNGTGLAGLMAHLRQRDRQGDGRNWLVFGERNAAHDDFFGAELDDLESRDRLARCDRVFSRDTPGEYVQHRLERAAPTLRDWMDDGAAIYLCGNAVGMAPGVERTLEKILGLGAVARLVAEGRLRRDVY